MSLYLNTLGRLEICWKGQITTALTLRKSQALLVYLALQPGLHDRNQLAGLLWGELPEKNARRNLRHALHTLRQALDPAILESDRLSAGLSLEISCRVDALAFEDALDQAGRHYRAQEPDAVIEHLETAVELYRGDFLDGFDVSDCLAFEEWVTRRRANLRVRFLEALDRLVTHWTRRGAYERALVSARRQLTQEPLSEKAHRQLMTLLALTGQRSAALAQYQACRRTLADELGLMPLEETTALYHTIKHSTTFSSGDHASALPARPFTTLPFAGRAQEHAALIDEWKASRHGDGRLTLVEGEAGVGKTRLLEEVLRYTETQGATVLRGRCYEFGGSLPYQPIAEALRSYLHDEQISLSPIWLSELACLLPDLHERHPDLPEVQRTTRDAARQRLFEAVTRLLSSLCDTRAALCLFLDDLHWADQSTLDLLHYLVRHLTHVPIWLVGTYRPEEVSLSHPLTRLRQGLSRDHQIKRLALGPLTNDSVETLATALVGEPEGAALGDFLHRESEGNAFILVETVSALEEKGVLIAKDTGFLHDHKQSPAWVWTGEPATETLPATIQDIVLQRVGRLSTTAQRDLTLVAVMGQPFDTALLWTAAQDQDRAKESLEEWLTRRLVTPQYPDSSVEYRASRIKYDFSHDKIRAVIYQSIEQGQRQRLHRRIGEALERRYTPHIEDYAASIAYHFERAGVVEKARVYLPLAAEQAAAVYANNQALDYYRRALALCPPSDERRWRILLQQADILNLVGEYDDAIEACQPVIESGEMAWQARAYRRLAQIHRIHRDYAAARRCAEESTRLTQMIDHAQDIRSSNSHAQALQTLGEIEKEQGDLVRAQQLFEAALEIYQKREETRGLANCYKGLGDILSSRGNYRQARARFEEAVRIYEKMGDKRNAGVCLRSIGMASWRLREYATARRVALRSMEICKGIGDRRGEAASLNSLGLLAIVQADHVETQRRLQASVAIYQDLGLEKRTAFGLHNLGISYMESGDMGASRRCLEQALEINRGVGSLHDQALDLGWLGKLHWLLKDYAAATECLDRALALDKEIGGGEEEDWHLIWRTAVACDSGDLTSARHYLRWAERMVAEGSANLTPYDIIRWQATLHLAEGDVETAQDLAQRAMAEAKAAGAQPGVLGELLTLLGRSFGARVQNDERARTYFKKALAVLPDAVPTMYKRAMALYHYGTYLAANGGQRQAQTHLTEAQDIFARIGVPTAFMR